MKLFSVSRLTLLCLLSVLLAACSATSQKPDQSNQHAPGTAARPVLSAKEAEGFTQDSYFAPTSASEAAWVIHPVQLPQTPDFVVGPPGTAGVQYASIQDAVNAAIEKHSPDRLYIAIMPGNYSGTVFIPKASNRLTLYGLGDSPLDTVIGQSLDGTADAESWRQVVNPEGEYQPGDPAWYMYYSCAHRQPIGALCSAVVWSQNDGLQLQNLTIANTLGDSVDAGNHPAVALRTDGDRVQISNVNILGRQNTLLVTNSDINNRLLVNTEQPRVLINHSYLEGDSDMLAGRGVVVVKNSTLRLVNQRTQKLSMFAPATLASQRYGFLITHSQLIAPPGSMAHLGRNWDVDSDTGAGVSGQEVNGQIVIRDSDISEGFANASPWGAAAVSGTPFAGNTGSEQDGKFSRNVNDSQFNRMWEYNNHGAGSEPVAAGKAGKEK